MSVFTRLEIWNLQKRDNGCMQHLRGSDYLSYKALTQNRIKGIFYEIIFSKDK